MNPATVVADLFAPPGGSSAVHCPMAQAGARDYGIAFLWRRRLPAEAATGSFEWYVVMYTGCTD